MLESQTFLGEESDFTSDRVRAEQEYVRSGLIFGINRNVFIMSICAAFNSVIIGFNIGVFGEIVYVLQDDMDLDMYECGILVGVLNFVAIFGSIIAGYTSDKFGRLKSFAAASILFFTGGVILVFSSGFTGLLVGRTILGLGTGIGFSVDPMYISEISPKEIRGALVTFSEIAINIGIVTGYFSTWVFSSLDSNISWRLMLMFGVLFPLIMLFLCLFWMEETPRYLMMQGNHRKAMTVLMKLSVDEKTAVGVFEDIQKVLKNESSYEKVSILDLLLGKNSKTLRNIMLVVVVVGVGQQLSGIDGVMGFMSFTLEEAGMNKRQDLFAQQFFIGLLKTLVLGISAKTLDEQVGRRRLLLISAIGAAMAHLLIAFGSIFAILWLETLGLYSFAVFFSIGLGPVSWLLISEILPLRVRSNGVMIGVALNRFAGFLVASTFLSLIRSISVGFTFIIFASICAGYSYFIYKYLPETKGLKLEEVEEVFEDESELKYVANEVEMPSVDLASVDESVDEYGSM